MNARTPRSVTSSFTAKATVGADVREGGVFEGIKDNCPEEMVSVKTLSAEQLIAAP
jgi:hypothetical protein